MMWTTVGVFVGDLVNTAIVEGEYLCAGIAEEDGRVHGDDELGVAIVRAWSGQSMMRNESWRWGESAASGSSRRKRPLRRNF